MYKAKESYSFLASLWELEEYCHLDDQRESFGSLPEMEGGFFIGDTMLKEAFTFEKLLPCHKLCRTSKQHRKDVINFELNLGYNLVKLSNEILSKQYKVGSYKVFKIYEPKERVIEALYYKDRLVLMAFCTHIIQPKLEKSLIYDNVACRKGKGTLFGLKRLEHFLRDYYKKYGCKGYFLKCDVTKYFQSINHDILIKNLSKTSLDDEDLYMAKTIIDSKNAETGVGLPIGNQTSQWFGLFYLNKIDRLIKEKLQIKYYVRYMDDMILVHHDKEYLKYCREQIEKIANNELNLKLNSKTQVAQLKNGIDFLGFRTILCENGKILRLLRSQAKIKMKHKLKLLGKHKQEKIVDDSFIDKRLNAYKGHLCHSNCNKIYYIYKNKNKL